MCYHGFRQLAALLCAVALALILFERGLRGPARYTQTGGAAPRPASVRLQGWHAALASAACGLWLTGAAIEPLDSQRVAEPGSGGTLNIAFQRYMTTTAGLAALVTVLWALLPAAEGFWEAAAVPSLSILLASLLPVLILMHLSGRQPRSIPHPEAGQ